MANSNLIRAAVLLVTGLSLLAFAGCEEKWKESREFRNLPDRPDKMFNADISVENPPSSIKAGSVSKVRVKVKNTGTAKWPVEGMKEEWLGVKLADHWLDKNGKTVIWDSSRARLPYDLEPGKEAVIEIDLKAPAVPGEYILEYDMVQEAVAWFKDRGSKTARIPVRVD